MQRLRRCGSRNTTGTISICETLPKCGAAERYRVMAAGFDGCSAGQGPELSEFQGRVSDSGEGRWTIKAAIDEGVPLPVLSSALYERFSSRGEADYQDKLLSAMRYQFGGHLEKP